jgi:hypothetical protein
MLKMKSLMFDNWINSDLIYINDILNENGEISQNLILDKLKYNNKLDIVFHLYTSTLTMYLYLLVSKILH